MGFIDGSVMAIALPAMRASLGATLAEAQWFANGYLLVLSALVLVGGAFGDRFGLARVFAAGIVVFVAASILCAIAWSPGTMVAARVAKGLGAAFMVPGSMAIIARVFPEGERGRAIGHWAAASAITTAAGPILGGLVMTFGPPGAWRLIFALNLPVGALALWLLLRHAPFDAGRPGRRIDLTGAALATLALALIAAALTGAESGLDRARALTAIAGLVTLVAFLAWETRHPDPMMPLGIIASRGFAAANLATLLLYFALTAVLFFLPMTAIAAWGVTALDVTAALLPFSILIGALSSRAGRLGDRLGPGPVMAAGSLLVALGFAILAMTAGMGAFWTAVLPAMTLAGLGMALVVAPLSTAVMAGTPDSGTASGINNAVARVASLLAVAAMGALAATVHAQAGGNGNFGLATLDAAERSATAAGFAAVASVAAALAAVSAIAALALPRPAQSQTVSG
jgi:EmrB/QacA subfamily drug resistance transporter